MAANFIKTETETETTITYTPILSREFTTYILKKDEDNLDIHLIVPAGDGCQTWQDIVAKLDPFT